MKKAFLSFVLFFTFLSGSVPLALAQGILPSTSQDVDQCEYILTGEASGKNILQSVQTKLKEKGNYEGIEMSDILACGIKTGRFKLWMVPFMILYLIQFLTVLAGVLSVAFIVVGGYHFIIGGVFEEKEKGKKTIKNALIGFVLSMLAYTIVNLVQIAVTS